MRLSEWVPVDVISGTGLIILDHRTHSYLFMLPREDRFGEKEGKLSIYYAGVGGRRTEGETFVECALREALEEIGIAVRRESRNTYRND